MTQIFKAIDSADVSAIVAVDEEGTLVALYPVIKKQNPGRFVEVDSDACNIAMCSELKSDVPSVSVRMRNCYNVVSKAHKRAVLPFKSKIQFMRRGIGKEQ